MITVTKTFYLTERSSEDCFISRQWSTAPLGGSATYCMLTTLGCFNMSTYHYKPNNVKNTTAIQNSLLLIMNTLNWTSKCSDSQQVAGRFSCSSFAFSQRSICFDCHKQAIVHILFTVVLHKLKTLIVDEQKKEEKKVVIRWDVVFSVGLSAGYHPAVTLTGLSSWCLLLNVMKWLVKSEGFFYVINQPTWNKTDLIPIHHNNTNNGQNTTDCTNSRNPGPPVWCGP